MKLSLYLAVSLFFLYSLSHLFSLQIENHIDEVSTRRPSQTQITRHNTSLTNPFSRDAVMASNLLIPKVNISAPDDFGKIVVFNSKGIEFSVPEAWAVTDEFDLESLRRITATGLDNESIKIDLCVKRRGVNCRLGDYVSGQPTIDGINNGNADFIESMKISGTVNGVIIDGYKTRYRLKINKIVVEKYFYSFNSGADTALITFTTTAENLPNDLESFEFFLSTFRIGKTFKSLVKHEAGRF